MYYFLVLPLILGAVKRMHNGTITGCKLFLAIGIVDPYIVLTLT